MNKSLLVFAVVALPFAALAAATGNASHDTRAPALPANAASAPANVDTRSAVRTAQQRGTQMAACRKEANDQGLTGQDAYKAALLACMKRGQ